MPHTPACVSSSGTLPLQGLTPYITSAAHACAPRKVSVGHKHRAPGLWTDASHISAASLLQPVFVQLFPPPPKSGEGAGSATSGRGQATAGPNQEFHTPNGPRLLCKTPTSSCIEAQSWLCSQAAGDHRGPSPTRGPGPTLAHCLSPAPYSWEL